MKKISNILRLAVLALMLSMTLTGMAQAPSVVVVVMNRDYTYQDPRFMCSGVLSKGDAFSVENIKGANYRWWLYPAANIDFPKRVAHIPGTVKGEKCIVITGTNVRFREKPSTNAGVLCDNVASTASSYHRAFISLDNPPKTDEWGLEAEWHPYYLAKGTRLPYKGKEGDFYKTEFNGMTLYISARYCKLK